MEKKLINIHKMTNHYFLKISSEKSTNYLTKKNNASNILFRCYNTSSIETIVNFKKKKSKIIKTFPLSVGTSILILWDLHHFSQDVNYQFFCDKLKNAFTNHKYQGLNSITFNICFIKGSLVSSDKKPFALRYIKNSDFNFINTLLEHHILPIYNQLKEVLPKKERKNIYHFQDAVSHSTLFKQICLLKNTASKLVARPIVHDNTFSSIKHYHNAMGIEKKK